MRPLSTRPSSQSPSARGRAQSRRRRQLNTAALIRRSVESCTVTEKPLFEHLARTAHEYWVAEEDGRIVGYARSILRDGNLELTEFFVLPAAQSACIGGELLRRTFAADAPGVQHRTIIATPDVRAQVRYLKAGVVPRFPEMYWTRVPENVPLATDLTFVKASSSPETLDHLANCSHVAALSTSRSETGSAAQFARFCVPISQKF